ncbi:MAG: N-methyl-L-tryptophan oxidase [Chthonomonadales bacterium]
MSFAKFDVIVVGVGAMGASTCYQLAHRGLSVLGLEQFSFPNNMGSSHGQSRAFRMAYFEHPDYVPLLRRSLELWQDLELKTEEKLLYVTGGLYLGRPDSELVSGSLKSCTDHGLSYAPLNHRGITSQYPQFSIPNDFVGLFEELAGVLLPERIIEGFASLARAHSAQINEFETVTHWESFGTGVKVTTNLDSYHADKLIFCGGAWSGQLLRDLDIPLVVTRQVTGWFTSLKAERFQLGMFPTWAIETPGNDLFYGMPALPGEVGLKAGHHRLGSVALPDSMDRKSEDVEICSLVDFTKDFIPGVGSEVSGMRACMYTNTPDGHFVLDQHPHSENVYIAAGFSGHGFKFASVVGEIMADFAERGTTDLPVSPFKLARFR